MTSPAPLHQQDVLLLIESERDDLLVRGFLHAAGLPMERIQTHWPVNGKQGIRSLIDGLHGDVAWAVLVDLDEVGVANARLAAQAQLGHDLPISSIFCAIPEIEAWLFADDQLLARFTQETKDEEGQALVRRLPLPEEIPYPRRLARDLFGPSYQNGEITSEMDMARAVARSPSLRDFIEGMARLLHVPAVLPTGGLGRTLQRDTLSGLLTELPSETVVWRSMSGITFTAGNLRAEIEQGSDIGRQYAADLLRISRDILRRTAARSAS